MNYLIKTHLLESDCLVLPFEEYQALRNAIIDHLLTIYERIDYKDADWKHYHIIIVGTIGCHRCTHCFHSSEWIGYYRDHTLSAKLQWNLDWGRKQMERIGDLSIPSWQRKEKQPVTATTVFRTAQPD